tara:strand:- start:538 stop:1326 length:789 start_codon:yes stop_codon:yes gene_type:complete
MKKWEKIEDKANSYLIKKFSDLKYLIINNFKTIVKYLEKYLISFINKGTPIFESVKAKIFEISKTNPKEIFTKIKQSLRAITFENIISLIKYPPYKKAIKILSKNSINIIFFLLFAFSAIQVYEQIKKINRSDELIYREIASNQKADIRPEYHLLKGRLLKIENIRIPVALTDKKRISSVIADVILECPNRTTQQFLYNSPHLIQDKLNNTIAPQINTFPLTEEGKIILRNKIGHEISSLLKESHFKHTKIQRVNIIQVTSS